VAMVSNSHCTLFRLPRNSDRIFILGGLFTIAMSAVAFFFVPTWPQKVKWVWEMVPGGLCPITHAIVVDRCRALPPFGPLG